MILKKIKISSNIFLKTNINLIYKVKEIIIQKQKLANLNMKTQILSKKVIELKKYFKKIKMIKNVIYYFIQNHK